MNKVHRIVWSDRRQAWVVAHEAAGTRGKPSSTRKAAMAAAVLALLGGTAGGAAAQAAGPAPHALPSGGQVVGGVANIGTQGARMEIVQTSPRAAIDWQRFDIGAQAQVHFQQPAGGAALNRVLGGDASRIFGQLTSTGQVFLVNPAGVMFAPGAQVDVGGLVASSRSISVEDFMAGRLTFEGTSGGAVVNQGRIRAGNGGLVAFIAARIVNTGSIEAPQGQVLMGAGNHVTLDLGGPVKIQIEQGALDAQIDQGGAIRADGGLVYLTARAADALASAAINQTGTIEANTLSTGEKGEIFLMADMAHGRLSVGGSLKADGGFIETSAAHVQVREGAQVQTGLWVLDPTDITVDAAMAGTLQGQLASGDARVETQAAGSGNGDIFVNAPITWSSGRTLTLRAHRNVEVNATLDASANLGGRLAVEYGVASVNAGNAALFTVNSPVRLRASGALNGINTRVTTFSSQLGSNGTPVHHTVITGVSDLRNIQSAGQYALGADIDMRFSSPWTPIGQTQRRTFSGGLDGLGNTVRNVTITSGSTDVGLFATTSGAQFQNLRLTSFQYGGGSGFSSRMGALAGSDTNSRFHNIFLSEISLDGADGNIFNGVGSGGSSIGGLLGSATSSQLSAVRGRFVNIDGSRSLGGLVGFADGAVFNNVEVIEAKITITGAAPGMSSSVGGIAGWYTGNAGAAVMSGAHARDVEIETADRGLSNGNIGGLVGAAIGVTIRESSASGTIEASNYTGARSAMEAYGGVGGLVGRLQQSALSNAYSTASVSLAGNQSGTLSGLGGLVGQSSQSTIRNAWSSGAVTHTLTGTAANAVGGFLGHNGGTTTLESTFWDNATSGIDARGIGSLTSSVGTVTGANPRRLQSGSTTLTPYRAEGFTGFDFRTVWFNAEGDGSRPFLRSEWSSSIAHPHHLQLMAMRPDARYTLANDIGMRDALADRSGMWRPASSVTSRFQGSFVPIGNANRPFTGSLDGRSRFIDDLWVVGSGAIGLFGVTRNATIQDLGLSGGRIQGDGITGILAGSLGSGTRVDRVTANVTVRGGSRTGGLVGHNEGSISRSSSAGIVEASGTGFNAYGGLVGENDGTIAQSFSTGQVTGGSNVGGLVGLNDATIDNSFSTGRVDGRARVGGLVGLNSSGARVQFAYSTGRVAAQEASVGGLIGFNVGGSTVENSFWDTQASGQATSGGGAGRTSAQMQDPATFSAWGDRVVLDPNVDRGGPRLQWSRFGASVSYAGTWAIYGIPIVAVSYNLGDASGTYTYQGRQIGLGSVWSAASIFGSAYSDWRLGVDYSFTFNGATVTGFTNAGTYSGIGVNVTRSNFVLASTGNTTGSLTIQPKTLTGTIVGGGSVYGQALSAGSVSLSGVVGNDVVSAGSVSVSTLGMTRSGSLNWNAGTFAGAQTVGAGLTGASAANYRFPGASAAYTITPATLSSVNGLLADTREYDRTTAATLDARGASLGGVLDGDRVTVDSAAASASFADANAGSNKAVSVTGLRLAGADAANYVLPQNGSASAQGEILRRGITAVTGVQALDKGYDNTTSATLDASQAGFTGLLAGDTLTVTGATGSFASADAGVNKPVQVTDIALGGTSAGNYVLRNSSANTSASIERRALGVSGVTVADKVYDGSTHAQLNIGSATLTGVLGSDLPTLAGGTAEFLDANAGAGKTVQVSDLSLTGPGAGNYTLASPTATASIQRAPLRVEANEFVSSTGASPLVRGQGGCVLAATCVSGIDLTGSALSLNFAAGQLASNYETTLLIGNPLGSLSVNRPLSWSGIHLELSAALDIHIRSALTASGATDRLTLTYGQAAAAAGNTSTFRFGSSDTGFAGRADLQAGANFSTRQGSDGTALNWTVITALGIASSSDATTLQGIQGDRSGRYVLGADIDAAATAGWNGGTGWTPLGTAAARFTGRFDGLGHTISNLSITRSSDAVNNHQGLFGYTDGARIANVGVDNASLTGARFIGALVGQGDNTQIDNAFARNATLTGERGVGGLAGMLRLGSNVNDSFATGETRGNGAADIAFHGGLVGIVEGFNAGSGNVAANLRRSFADVDVASAQGSDASRIAGGLVGLFRGAGVIEDSQAMGAVRGRSALGADGTGGLVGRLGTGGDAVSASVLRSQASGAVSTTGGTVIGGLVGAVGAGSVSNSFWDTQTTGRATSAGGAGAVGRTSEQMQRMDTFVDAGWDVSLTEATSYAGIADFRRAGINLDGQGGWRINPRYIPYAVPTIGSGRYIYHGQAQTPIEWTSRAILGDAFSGWVLGTDYVLTSGGQSITGVTNAGDYTNLGVRFLRGGAGQYLNATSGNTDGRLVVDRAVLQVRAVDDARFVTQAENPLYAGVQYRGFLGSDSAASLGGSLTIARSGGGSNTAGSYTLTPSGLSSGNYSFQYESGVFQIVAADRMLVKTGTVLGSYGELLSFGAPTVQYLASGSVLTLDAVQQTGNRFVFAEPGAPQHTVSLSLAAGGGSLSTSGWLNVGRYAVTGSDVVVNTPNYVGGAANMVLSGQVDLQPKAVTAEFLARKTYDRSTSFTPTVAAGGVVAGDQFSLGGNLEFASRQGGVDVGWSATLTASGADAANYTVAGASRNSDGSFTVRGRNGIIDRKLLGVSGLAGSDKVYDGNVKAAFSGTATLTGGVLAGDSVSLLGSALGTFGDRHVGTGKSVTLGGLQLGGDDSANYRLSLPSGFTASITPATITAVTGITAQDKVYDGGTHATLELGRASLSGRIGQDQVVLGSGSGSFADRNAGTGKTVSVTGLTLAGEDAGNYTLASSTSSTTASIRPATIAGIGGLAVADKDYDGSAAATLDSRGATFAGRIGNDQLNVAGGSANFADADAGNGKSVAITGLVLGGSDAGNYLLAERGASTSASIQPRLLTISGSSAASKVYDGGTGARVTVGTLAGLVGGQTLGLSASGQFATANAGTGVTVNLQYTLADGGNGGLAANYRLAGETLQADIQRAAATVVGNSASSVYNGLQQSVAGFTVSGLVGQDTAAVLGGVGASGASGINSGSYVNAVSGPTVNGNYNLSFADGVLSIGRAAATVTAHSGSTVYNGQVQSLSGFTAAGLVNGETAASVLGGVSAGVSGTQAGRFAHVASGSAANYDLSFVNGEFVIDQAPATVTARSAASVYTGLAQRVTGFDVSGLVAGESPSVLAGITTSGGTGTDAGRHVHGVSGAASNGNYRLTFVDGALDIRQAEATVTGQSASVVYNRQAHGATGFTVTGLVNGETASVLQGVSATGASATDAGFYVNAVLGASDNGNYRLSFVNGALVIDKAEATVTANSRSVVYNGLEQVVGGHSISGLLPGDDASLITGLAGGASGVNAGRYTHRISGSNPNYSFTFVDGSLVIDKAQATVTANGGRAVYNGLEQITSGFTASGLVNGETASVLTGVTAGGSGVGAGTYATRASGSDANYELTFVDGRFVIDKAQTTVIANSGRATYNGRVQGTSGFTASGLVNGETASVLTGVTAGGGGIGAGTYATRATGSDANYELTFVDGSFVIDKAQATVTSSSGRTTYNGLTQSTSGFTASGLVNGETESVLTGITAGGSGIGAGTYVTRASGGDANYVLTFVDGSLVIDRARIVLDGLRVATKAYDGGTAASIDASAVRFGGLVDGDTLTLADGVARFADKNVGTGKTATFSGLVLGGAAAANYRLDSPSATVTGAGEIVRLGRVAWVGGPSGSWFDPTNWAGGAVPDLRNVVEVQIPAGVVVSFGALGAVAPADATQAVRIDRLLAPEAGLRISGGELHVDSDVRLATHVQIAGELHVAGRFGTSREFQQSGGRIVAGGDVDIAQAEGGVSIAGIEAGGNLSVQAPGRIQQGAGSVLDIGGTTQLTSTTNRVRLNTGGNRFDSAPTIVQADDADDSRFTSAVGDALRAATSAPRATRRGAAGASQVQVIEGGIRLPQNLAP
jgi:trimeric autotransporter adhesin